MKRILLVVVASVAFFSARPTLAQFGSILGTVKSTIEQKVDQKAQKATSDAMDTALQNGSSQSPNSTNGNGNSNRGGNSNGSGSTSANNTTSSSQTISAYQNYDFKPGEQIIFADNFTDDEDGEFPSHWDLDAGQGVVNKVDGEPAFLLTSGDYAKVAPRMDSKSYLTDTFTVEFDFLPTANCPLVRFIDKGNAWHDIHFDHHVNTTYFAKDLDGSPVGSNADFVGHWHHAALIYKHDQLKAYIDNTRALVMPHCGLTLKSLEMGGIGEAGQPVTFKNFRLANGGGSITIGDLLTKGKFVTHGITFDIGKATIRPESMGVLNGVRDFLKSNSGTTFEIDGYTDNDGSADMNKTLSQERADAVKTQLVAMGLNGSHLKTKGFGSENPISPNDSPEGKANNRRVEFVKQ